MPTNPFSTSNRRQQVLVPKELFPRKNHNTADQTNKLTLSSSFRRPVKLPLRKHHSFHFQSSQTVAGALKHEQFQQKEQTTAATAATGTKDRYKNQGPLVFMPFSEKSAFKPIVPTQSPDDVDDGDSGDLNDRNDFDTMPRICGSSLKRHISNVETFTPNHWRNNDEDNSQKSIIGRRKIHYADLAPLSSGTNDRNNNNNANEIAASKSRTKINDLQTKSSNIKQTNGATATQYATLRFDEVSI